MTREPNDELQPPIEDYRPPPPFPADSLWRGIEAAEGGRPAGDPGSVRLPRVVAAAAAISLLAGGAVLGSILQARLGGPGIPAAGVEETGTSSAQTGGATAADASHVIWF